MSDRNGRTAHKTASGRAWFHGIILGMVLLTMTLAAPAHADTISVDIDRNAYDVEYTATGMTVSGVDADLDLISLILSVDVTDPQATLEVTLDRAFFDSVVDGQDYGFIVLSDGDEARFSVSQPDAATNVLSISLPIGTEEVEIVGASFGAAAAAQEPDSDQVSEPADGSDQVSEPEPESGEKPSMESGDGTDGSGAATGGTSTTQCGEGTVLKDGVCVLDERCGEGTILKDGVCVLVPAETATRTTGGDLAAGSVGGFAIAGLIAVGAIIILKISRRKHTSNSSSSSST